MKRLFSKPLVAFTLLCVLVVVAFVPVMPGAVTYRSVLDTSDATAPDSHVSSHKAGVQAHDLYAIHDNVLYLRCQTTYSAAIIVTGVSFDHWTLRALAAFRDENPDLERYWPDPAAPNAGVDWIPNSN